jgi:hypothetical protein
MLAVGARLNVTLVLLPTVAAILDASAVVTIEGGELLLPIRLAARSKFQFISLSSSLVDLGDVLRGGGGVLGGVSAAMKRMVTVTNRSSVRATLQVSPAVTSMPTPGGGAYFAIFPTSVLLPPGGTADLAVMLSADAPAGARPCERFAVSVPGGNTVILTCAAAVTGPRVSAARKDRAGAPPAKRPLTVQFGDLEVRAGSSASIELSAAGDPNHKPPTTPSRAAFHACRSVPGQRMSSLLRTTAGLQLIFLGRVAPTAFSLSRSSAAHCLRFSPSPSL